MSHQSEDFITWYHLLGGRTVRLPAWMHPALNDWDKPNWRKVIDKISPFDGKPIDVSSMPPGV